MENGLKPNLVKGKFGKDHVASRPFVCVETGKIYYCQRELAEELGGGMEGVSHLTRACRFGYLDHGYHWRYYEPNELVELLFEKGYTKYPMSYDGDYWFCYIQMACAWLRDKGYHIYTFKGVDSWVYEVQSLNDDWTYHLGGFEDHDEAIEAALKYTLENLI